MATGILRIQTFAARQSSPEEGVIVTVQGDGFTAVRLTDAEGMAADLTIETPECRWSLEESNSTVLPYAVCTLTAEKTGFRPVVIEGVQIFPGQVTLAQPEMIPETSRALSIQDDPVKIPVHALFAGGGGSGPGPEDQYTNPQVLDEVVIPKNITVHLGKPAASAKNVTVSFRNYIANVASSEVYPTWACPTNPTAFLHLPEKLQPAGAVFFRRVHHQLFHKAPGQAPGQLLRAGCAAGLLLPIR